MASRRPCAALTPRAHQISMVWATPYGRVVHVQVVADGAYHHLARVQADANLYLDAVRAAHLGAVATDSILHGQGGVTEVVEIRVIQAKPALQGAVGDTALVLEELEDLGQEFLKGHHRPSSCPCVLSDIVPAVTPHAAPVLELPVQSGRALLAASMASRWH